MKKIILSVALLLAGFSYSQDTLFGKHSIDFGVGAANQLSPDPTAGYDATFFDPLTVNLGYRYMINKDFGLFGQLQYNNLSYSYTKNPSSLLSTELVNVTSNYFNFTFQGCFNLTNTFNFHDFTDRVGILFHAGAGAAFIGGKNKVGNFGKDLHLVLTTGVSPHFKINEKFALNLDLALNFGLIEQKRLDLQSFTDKTGLGNYFGTGTIGINYYGLSKNGGKVHADWAGAIDKTTAELEALKNRIKQVENKLVDTDKDGVADYLDLEPNTPEGSVVNTHGQKVVDTDGDGIEDTQDYCPTVKGTAEFKGCPTAVGTTTTTVVEGKEVEGQLKYDVAKYTTDINFETKSTAIKNASKKQLDELAKILISNNNLIINLHGHCDNVGEDILNNKLSLDRANVVKDYLVSKGVNVSQITTTGHGTSQPKVSNDTEKGRSANRRVEFVVKTK
jgi:OOP family OmpA-OmpF porin